MPRLMMAMAAAADEDPSLQTWMAAFELRTRQFLGMALQRFGARPDPRRIRLGRVRSGHGDRWRSP